jgi:phosphatidylserine/phosphatidylglycerophosphate/cardiolipin synthase-like enzyme
MKNKTTLHPALRMLVCTSMLLCVIEVKAQNPKIKVYFNRFVNTAVSTGTPATYLHNTMADTIAAYIKRAKYTVDIAQYDYSASSSASAMAVIANACNSAQVRGVVVRWVYDGSQPNTGLTLLNSGVNKLASPVATGYIMHQKFMVVDVNSTTASDVYILTGSNDWGITQTDSCYNNLVVFQDKPLANAYYLEFNKMWGGTGATPVSANSKFGTTKTHSALNSFNVNGTTVELFFSPKDSSEAHLAKAINTVNNELFFGIYTFTSNTIANLIKTKYQAGISVFGIMDSYSKPNSPYTTLSPVMGANLQVFTGATSYVVYHNKTMLIDPLTPSSDPQVFTGSYNWTGAGTAANDENAIIIHDATITNEYYQSFCRNFTDVGGTACPNIATSIEEAESASSLLLYPNPFSDELTIRLGAVAQHTKIRVFDHLGRIVKEDERFNTNEMTLPLPGLAPGMYMVALDTDGQTRYRKVLK